MAIGSYHTSPADIIRIFLGKITGDMIWEWMGRTINLFWTIRLPRIAAACLAGAGLSLSGAVFQSMFKNPLASPYTLGVSNGAGFGAALGIVLSLGTVGIQGLSACFGLISIGITFLLASRSKSGSTTLVLAGMLVSALFSSLVALLKFVADPFEKLPQIVFWLMGSLSGSSQDKVLYILPVYFVSFLLIWLYRWKINVMSMGDREAASYGAQCKNGQSCSHPRRQCSHIDGGKYFRHHQLGGHRSSAPGQNDRRTGFPQDMPRQCLSGHLLSTPHRHALPDSEQLRDSDRRRHRNHRRTSVHVLYSEKEGGLVMRLEVNNISFQYSSEKTIFRDLSFSYETPGILCILGSNGTGKSTLLKCLLRQNHVQQGSILIDGKNVEKYRPRELARKVAYLPQSHVPSFAFPVIDVVMMGRTSRIGYFASPGKEDRAIAMDKLEYLHIGHLAEKPYTALSGGERQMVMIASALAQEPELIILDEPTSHLDFGNQFRFVKLVEQLHRLGIGVLMTTHFPDHALYLDCDTIILHNSGIIASGNAHDVITDANMSEIYRIDTRVVRIEGREICVPL